MHLCTASFPVFSLHTVHSLIPSLQSAYCKVTCNYVTLIHGCREKRNRERTQTKTMGSLFLMATSLRTRGTTVTERQEKRLVASGEGGWGSRSEDIWGGGGGGGECMSIEQHSG